MIEELQPIGLLHEIDIREEDIRLVDGNDFVVIPISVNGSVTVYKPQIISPDYPDHELKHHYLDVGSFTDCVLGMTKVIDGSIGQLGKMWLLSTSKELPAVHSKKIFDQSMKPGRIWIHRDCIRKT
jgi:hypothetical protein